jgi:hypothetical protein
MHALVYTSPFSGHCILRLGYGSENSAGYYYSRVGV